MEHRPDYPVSRRTLLEAAGATALAGAGAAVFGDAAAASAAADPARPARETTPLDTGWRFHPADAPGAQDPGFDDSGWADVRVPHTWNAIDGANGDAYYRGIGWYRLAVPPPAAGRRHFLDFGGACLVSDVWWDGKYAGHHAGGYGGFRFDVTDLVSPGRAAVLAVKVSNASDPGVAPLGGDFSVEGGLYRDVQLISTDPVHIDALDYGGPGVYVRQRSVSAVAAELDVTVRVTNDSARKAAVTVGVVIGDGDAAATAVRDVTVAAGSTVPVTMPVRLARPRLWNGLGDPYLYQVTARVSAGGGDRDAVGVPLGIRTFSVDADKGFFLNGKPYLLRGVNTHQSCRPATGVAVSHADVDADYAMIRDLGANVVRMAHYQHSQREYDNCDRLGIVVWTEIPLVGWKTVSDAFTMNTQQQLRELIRQNYNHPSVAFWGLGNEQYASDAYTNQLLASLQALAHADDPERLTTYAHCCLSDTDPLTSHSDVIGYNRYYGWYVTPIDGVGPWADGLHAADPPRRTGVSEYGAGGSPVQHEQDQAQPVPGSTWHPEEWQAIAHEHNWNELSSRPFVWGRFVWVMFDLPSAGRNEGDRPGINDKGLVTLDRTIKKDAFYWYQANWSPRPVVHITSARDTPRFTATTSVKVYANTPAVELRVNGITHGTVTPAGHIAQWSGVPLSPGSNVVEAIGLRDGRRVTDTATWERDTSPAGTSAAVNSGSAVPYTDASGHAYAADHDVSASQAGRTGALISGTADQPLYQTYRSGYFAYRIPLANGTYEVTLKFAEPEHSRSGRRVFNVNAQAARALANLDIYAEAGKNAALDKTVTATVADGVLGLEFVPLLGEAIVSAIVAARQS